jgi:hypothetical protein
MRGDVKHFAESDCLSFLYDKCCPDFQTAPLNTADLDQSVKALKPLSGQRAEALAVSAECLSRKS